METLENIMTYVEYAERSLKEAEAQVRTIRNIIENDRRKKTSEIDLSKPVMTRAGKSVRILCTDRKLVDRNGCKHSPIVGLILHDDGFEEPFTWYQDGRVFDHMTTESDLVNAPKE